jgi:chemotaxis protein CheZ
METEQLLKELKQEITNQISSVMQTTMSEVVNVVQSSLLDIVQQEFVTSLNRSLTESDFLKSVNGDIRNGLASIYKEINGVKESVDINSYQEAKDLFSETENKLDYVISTTEKASMDIMDEVENLQEMQEKIKCLLPETDETALICEEMNTRLITIMTALSFQDLTGQHVKKIINVLQNIEKIVLDIYISSGIMLKNKEAHPEKNLDELKKESKEKYSTMQEEGKLAQDDIDAMLAQLD